MAGSGEARGGGNRGRGGRRPGAGAPRRSYVHRQLQAVATLCERHGMPEAEAILFVAACSGGAAALTPINALGTEVAWKLIKGGLRRIEERLADSLPGLAPASPTGALLPARRDLRGADTARRVPLVAHEGAADAVTPLDILQHVERLVGPEPSPARDTTTTPIEACAKALRRAAALDKALRKARRAPRPAPPTDPIAALLEAKVCTCEHRCEGHPDGCTCRHHHCDACGNLLSGRASMLVSREATDIVPANGAGPCIRVAQTPVAVKLLCPECAASPVLAGVRHVGSARVEAGARRVRARTDESPES